MKKVCGRCKYFERKYKKNYCNNEDVYTDDEKLHFYFKACRYFEWSDRLKSMASRASNPTGIN